MRSRTSKGKTLKTCGRCKIQKPVSDFGRDAQRADGRFPYCRDCRRNPVGPVVELNRLAKSGKRRCSICKAVKSFDAFHSDLSKSTGVYSSCKKCIKKKRMEKSKSWHDILAEKDRLLSLGQQKCLGCNEVMGLSQFGRDSRNSSGHKPRCLKCMREYYANRRSSKRDYVRIEIFDRDGYFCYLCENDINPLLTYPHPQCASIDHVVPISKGGPDLASNVRATHLQCNLDKKDFTLEEYFERQLVKVG